PVFDVVEPGFDHPANGFVAVGVGRNGDAGRVGQPGCRCQTFPGEPGNAQLGPFDEGQVVVAGDDLDEIGSLVNLRPDVRHHLVGAPGIAAEEIRVPIVHDDGLGRLLDAGAGDGAVFDG